MSPSGERRLPDAIHPVLLFGSRRAVQRIDVTIDAVAPPVVWNLSTRVKHRPQGISGYCIDQPGRFRSSTRARE
jgi:hypothetical protein